MIPLRLIALKNQKKKVGQPSNNLMGPQCFGCQRYSHMKFECPTYLKSKGKAMVVTFSDNEISNDESSYDKDESFITFTATVVINKSVSAEENPSNGELSEDADFKKPTINFAKLLQMML